MVDDATMRRTRAYDGYTAGFEWRIRMRAPQQLAKSRTRLPSNIAVLKS
jgi:hypothetical protein